MSAAAPAILAFSASALDDLAWYYQAAECELGLSSASGPMLDRLRDGTQGVVYSGDGAGCAEDARLDAMELHRNVRELLWRVGKRVAGHLQRLHAPRQWPLALVRTFGAGAPLAAVTRAARDAYKLETREKAPRVEAVAWWLGMTLQRATRLDRMTANAVAVECRQLRDEAYVAYEHQRALVTAAQPRGRAKRYPYTGKRAVYAARRVEQACETFHTEQVVADVEATHAAA